MGIPLGLIESGIGNQGEVLVIDQNGNLIFASDTAQQQRGIILPGGDTASRPAIPPFKAIRYNTDLSTLEFYDTGWFTAPSEAEIGVWRRTNPLTVAAGTWQTLNFDSNPVPTSVLSYTPGSSFTVNNGGVFFYALTLNIVETDMASTLRIAFSVDNQPGGEAVREHYHERGGTSGGDVISVVLTAMSTFATSRTLLTKVFATSSIVVSPAAGYHTEVVFVRTRAS